MQRRGRSGSLHSLSTSWHKLTFLRILLFDILISLGDTVTDFLQSFDIIKDVDPAALEHRHLLGLLYVLVIWVPLPLVLAHLVLSAHTELQPSCGVRATLLLVIVATLFWPFVPTLVYTVLLFRPSQSLEWRVSGLR